ncbi:MAG TPA: GNAT family N-acetyltransferase [Planctomycetaceae bacterium]|jgi:energy-coupling factor transporter ATP-binding protein EcfA2|nr:GNAT family N-acetyltransferase [Planctomycetaceae bacterium]
MPSVDCLRSVPIERTPRVKQLEGLFDVPPADRSERRWQVSLPLEERDWNVGLIVGPSGCGKSTLARACFGKQPEPSWPSDRAIVDVFPAALGIKEIVSLLSSVGFSSPPAWLRPYHALSTGEQFRVQMARALAECAPITVIDEFTSVVDRTVARIGSAAIARTVRARGTKFVAVTCHYDVAHWLDADWIYDSAADEFSWRCLQGRPRITLAIARVHRSAWRLFKPHHYLSGDLNPSARCFVAFVEDRPAAFAAVISGPDAHGGHFREHRVVCLPDFQGVGIGNALSEFVASLYVSRKRYFSRTSHPGMIRHRMRSSDWTCLSQPGFKPRHTRAAFAKTGSTRRLAASFRFVGPPRSDEARRFGILSTIKSPRLRVGLVGPGHQPDA